MAQPRYNVGDWRQTSLKVGNHRVPGQIQHIDIYPPQGVFWNVNEVNHLMEKIIDGLCTREVEGYINLTVATTGLPITAPQIEIEPVQYHLENMTLVDYENTRTSIINDPNQRIIGSMHIQLVVPD